MFDQFKFFIEALAALIAAKIIADLRKAPVITPRLLSIDDAAIYLGRTDKAVRHMLEQGKLKNASPDGRVQVDIKDLEILITNSKR